MNVPSQIQLDTRQIPECLKAIHNVGSTVYQDICHGTLTSVPWGGIDWLVFVGLSLLALATLSVLAVFSFMVWSDL